MYDLTRRFMTIFLFLVLGPTLTAALLGSAVLRQLPLAAEWEKQTIRAAIGWNIELDSVVYQKPNDLLVRNLLYLHPNTGKPLVSCPELELRLVDDPNDPTKKYWECIAETVSITIDPHEKTQAMEVLCKMFLSLLPERFSASERIVYFRFSNVDIQIPDTIPEEKHKLILLHGKYSTAESLDQIDCSFNMSDDLTADPIHWVSSRTRSDKVNQLNIKLKTDETLISTRFLALVFPMLKFLGNRADFSGTIRGESVEPNCWTITIEDAMLRKAEVHRIAAMLTPYQIVGEMNVGIDTASFQVEQGDTHLQKATGWFEIAKKTGSIQKELLSKLIEQFQLEPKQSSNTPSSGGKLPVYFVRTAPTGMIAVHHTVVYFDMNEKGCAFSSSNETGLILSLDENNHLYLRKKEGYYSEAGIQTERYSYASILFPFMPDNAELVPLTPQSQRILKIIPLK